MVYTYIGKGTIIPGIKNKRVEELKPGDKILGFYIGFGRKRHAESRIKSVRLVGQSSCIKVGSLSEPALIYPKQLTVGPGFKFTNIEKTVYSVSRITPKPYLINKDVDNIEIYEIILEDGDVVITVPAGKFRCPPAPFERACMIAAYMKKEEIPGKVIILNPSKKVAKGAAFKEAWKELYGDRIIHMENCKITDVDPDAKTISFTQEGAAKTHKYAVLNLIPNNKANPVVEMSGVETVTTFGKIVMNGCSFQTKTDADIYAVGDVVGHAIPPSGQTAIWSGKQCVEEIAHRLHGKSYELAVKTKTQSASNVCYSMVETNQKKLS